MKEAWQNMVPVNVGAGVGHEDRIMENRRLKLKNGKEADVRHAYSLPPDEEVAGVGPVDPEIGILRLDRKDGQTLAVVYNFACHPIQGVPSGGNTADITGFASQVIEDNLSDGAIALFLQGCARRHQSGSVQGRRQSPGCRAVGKPAGPQHHEGLRNESRPGTTAS